MSHSTEKNVLNQPLTIGSCPARQASAIKEMWRIFATDKSSVLELRALWPKNIPGKGAPIVKHLRAANYADVEALKADFEQKALALNSQGYNVYTVMNPIRSDFAGPGAARDADIRYRDLLLIDIDRLGDTSLPATEAELDAAKSLAGRIRAHLSVTGFPEPVVVMSGNGYHLYYVLDALPNDSDTDAAISTLLRNLAKAYDNGIVGVDTTVYNASRITKVPGTIMRKGIATADRPYRMAEVCDEE